jgi:hypothetical protein
MLTRSQAGQDSWAPAQDAVFPCISGPGTRKKMNHGEVLADATPATVLVGVARGIYNALISNAQRMARRVVVSPFLNGSASS